MNQEPETYTLFLYAALIPAMILAAILLGWADKRFGNKQRDPLKLALVRLKYLSLIATVVIFVLWIRLPPGVHIGSVNSTENLERLLDKILQTIAIGMLVGVFWFASAYHAIRTLSASVASRAAVPKATSEPV